jgi:subtilase family serine protease
MSKHLPSRQIFTLLAFLYLLTVSPAFARQQLHGHVPQEANASSYLGAMDTTATLNLAIGLPMQNTDEMNQLLNELYDPHSPFYHQYLTPDEVAARFGPSESDYQSVIDFVAAHHLTITRTYTNRLIVDVTGTVDDIQKTFHVNLNRYQRSDGSEFHAPDQEPSVDLDIPLTHISGLDNFKIPKPAFRPHNTLESQTNPLSGTGPTGSYFGSDFRNSYIPCISSSINGAGQTVALVEFSSYLTNDITDYTNLAGFTSPNLNNIGVDGFSTSSAPVTDDPISGQDFSEEVCLDIDMVLCMAHSCWVDVYEESINNNGNDLLNQIASDNTAKVISCSWTDFTNGPVSMFFNSYALQGQSFFQAAGDTGAYVSGDPFTQIPDPIDTVNSEMTVVGGTQLTTSNSPFAYTSETTWNDPTTVHGQVFGGASGGGICGVNSTPVPIPTYQVPYEGINSVSNQYRNIPDVSMVAVDIFIYGDNAVTELLDGTSASTPLWAGLTALINQQAQSEVKGPMGFMNPALYNLASNSVTYARDFHDVITGNNNYSGANPSEYAAAATYNLATGLGSPGCSIIGDIIAPLSTNTITPTPTITNTPTITPTPTNTPTITNTPTPPTTTTSYAYPQPARNSQVYIVYNSPVAQQARINIYSLSGQEVDSVMDNSQASNQNRILISLQGFVPSVYFYVINGLSSGVLAKGKFLVVP